MKVKPVSIALLAAVALAVLCGGLSAQAQSPAPAGSPAAAPPAAVHKSLLTQILEGGWVMIPIAACSILTVYLVGDGIASTNPKKLAPAALSDAVRDLFRVGDYVGAYNYCKANPSPLTNVVRVGVSHLGDGQLKAETAMSEELVKENSHLQTKLSYLSVIGVCTPMIGLLGTVTGMMGAFSTLGTNGIGDPSRLAGSIGEVLVATASGLFIAIPAFGFFYYLRNRAAAALHVIEDTVNSFFRKMPYELLHNVHIGDEEIIAGTPNWIEVPPPPAEGYASPSSQIRVPTGQTQNVSAQAPV